MNPFWLSIIFIVGIILLVRSSDYLVSLLHWMARYLRMSEYSVAFLLMAGATSIPELFVGINAASSGLPELSLGNVLGANVLNLTLVIGIVALLRTIPLDDERTTHEAGFVFALTITPLILFLDGTLSRADGAMLIFLFLAYLRYLFAASKIPDDVFKTNTVEQTFATFREFVKKLFLFLAGAAVLLIASRLVVFAANEGALLFGVPPFLVGIAVLSLGTTLPELTFALRSAFSGHGGMGLGNAIGSVMFNILFVMGIVALIQPITLQGNTGAVYVSLLAVIFSALALHVALKVSGRISRGMGAFLLLIFAAVAMFVFEFI